MLASNGLRADAPLGPAPKLAVTVPVAGGLPVAGATTTSPTTASSASRTTAATVARAAATRTTRPQEPQQPALAPAPQPFQPETKAPAAATQLSSTVFGSGNVKTSQLAQERRGRASATSSDVVLGGEAGFRASTDAGSLLGKSNQTRGVTSQKRTPIITDTRVRGTGVGGLIVGG